MEGIIIAIISLALCSFLLGFMIATDVCKSRMNFMKAEHDLERKIIEKDGYDPRICLKCKYKKKKDKETTRKG